jgi:hypothetical protein
MKQNNKNNKINKIKKSKQMNVVSIDLEQKELKELKEVKEVKEVKDVKEVKEVKEVKPIESFINNIDLLYLTNQVQYAKTNKLENLLSNNSLLKEIFDNLEDNINLYKEQILKYNTSTLEKLLATNSDANNNTNTNINEKYKMYYLLYVLNLILHLKEKKMKNMIKDELKEYSNSSINNQSVGDFNITAETINCMCPQNETSKKIPNLDLFVVRKSNKYNKKILPQKRE